MEEYKKDHLERLIKGVRDAVLEAELKLKFARYQKVKERNDEERKRKQVKVDALVDQLQPLQEYLEFLEKCRE